MAAALPMMMAAVASSVVSSALAPSPQSAPQATGPRFMPTADYKDMMDAKKKSIAAQMARRGRASTILTENQKRPMGDGGLGGGDGGDSGGGEGGFGGGISA